MLKIIVIAILFYSIIILLNIYIYRSVINKAIDNFIKPKLQDKGLSFLRYKWLGFFNRGAFTNDTLVLIPSLKFGYPIISIYIDIYFTNGVDERKISVRIDKSLFLIRKIYYSDEL